MAFKEQLGKLKDNWLIILLVVLVAVLVLGGGSVFNSGASMNKMLASDAYYGGSMESSRYYPGGDGDFAPDVEERIIQRSATLRQEVERGAFDNAVASMKNVLSASDSIILNENINRYGSENKEYRQGSFNIKIPEDKYDATIAQLKDVAKVTSFTENARDVTGQSLSLDDQIATEQGRLVRYERLQDKTNDVEQQLELIDRIYDQERVIASLEARKNSLDSKVEYATVSVTLNEKQSSYQNVQFVKFSELVRTVVGSAKALLYFIAAVLPWLLIAFIIWLIVRKRG